MGRPKSLATRQGAEYLAALRRSVTLEDLELIVAHIKHCAISGGTHEKVAAWREIFRYCVEDPNKTDKTGGRLTAAQLVELIEQGMAARSELVAALEQAEDDENPEPIDAEYTVEGDDEPGTEIVPFPVA